MKVAVEKEAVETRIRRFCTFRLIDRLYGVPIRDVKEINLETNFTPIFHAPKEVKGYINIRGQIYLLLDLRLILGFPAKEINAASRVVLFMPELGDPCGVLVDSIDDVVTVDENRIENRRRENRNTPDILERRKVDVGEGVCKLKDELLVILNSEKLVHVIDNLDNSVK